MKKIFVDKKYLRHLYVKKRLSCPAIADLLGGVTRQAVWKAIRRHGIKIRSKKDAIFFENGQRCKISQGYFWIYMPGHPFSNNNYVRRATLALEQKLGRPLQYKEIAHHKDLNRLNDDPSNLELTNRREHPTVHSLMIHD